MCAHKVGDRVRVSTPKLGVLENEVTTCDQAKPWTFGISALIRNLAGREVCSSRAHSRFAHLLLLKIFRRFEIFSDFSIFPMF